MGGQSRAERTEESRADEAGRLERRRAIRVCFLTGAIPRTCASAQCTASRHSAAQPCAQPRGRPQPGGRHRCRKSPHSGRSSGVLESASPPRPCTCAIICSTTPPAGISSALDTLSSQAYGAGQHAKLGEGGDYSHHAAVCLRLRRRPADDRRLCVQRRSSSQSMQQIWTVLKHDGPNHLAPDGLRAAGLLAQRAFAVNFAVICVP